MGKDDIDGAGELAVDCFQLGVDFAKEILGNRMLQAEKIVQGVRVGLDGQNNIVDVVLRFKDGVDNRFLTAEVDVVSELG